MPLVQAKGLAYCVAAGRGIIYLPASDLNPGMCDIPSCWPSCRRRRTGYSKRRRQYTQWTTSSSTGPGALWFWSVAGWYSIKLRYRWFRPGNL